MALGSVAGQLLCIRAGFVAETGAALVPNETTHNSISVRINTHSRRSTSSLALFDVGMNKTHTSCTF